MSTATPLSFQPIRELLAALRARIRRYVVWDGLLIAARFAMGMFWLGFALDYLPVRLGASEMPRGVRFVLALLVLAGLTWIAVRWVLLRLWVPLQDRNLALLVERRHAEFGETLLTAVDTAAPAGPFGRRLQERTLRKASEHVGRVDLRGLLNYRPLVRRGLWVLAFAGSIAAFAAADWPRFQLACARLIGLSDTPYPRQTLLEVLEFVDHHKIVPRGSDVTIRVRADARRPQPPPQFCSVLYRLSDRTRGRVRMSRVGDDRDGYQYYVFSGKPFQAILSDIRFDVRGNDFRARGYSLQVADRPQVVDARVRIELPSYTGLGPRDLPYHVGMSIPRGSRVDLTLKTSKPLLRATRQSVGSSGGEVVDQTPTGEALDQLQLRIDALDADWMEDWTLVDTDHIPAERPYRIHLAAAADRPPQLDVRLRGIGSAITPDALLPFEGRLEDDYGVASVSVAVEQALPAANPDGPPPADSPTIGSPPREFPMSFGEDGTLNVALDLRELRQRESEPLNLPLQSRVWISVWARDNCQVGSGPNLTQSERYEMQVVSPEQLLALLESRELGLRQRFEQMLEEMRDMRESLQRAVVDHRDAARPKEDSGTSSADDVPPPEGLEPEDLLAARDTAPGDRMLRRATLRSLRVQRAAQHVLRAEQEVLGVGQEFGDIRLELRNNRVDSAERQARLETDLERPLLELADPQLVELARCLNDLHSQYLRTGPRDAQQLAESLPLAEDCLSRTDEVILTMERILAKMLDLESYSELLDLVRELIQQQEALERKMREEQRKKARELLKE